MFETAVVCTDLSDDSDALVECAGELGVLGVSRVVLAHVVDVFEHPEFGSLPESADSERYESQLAYLERCGLDVIVDTPIGHTSYSIDETAIAHGATLIVMGSHGLGLTETGFSGSVSSDLVRVTERPVLLIPTQSLARDAKNRCARLVDKVLYPTDFSEHARRAEGLLEQIASRGSHEIVLLHIREIRLPGGPTVSLLGHEEGLEGAERSALDRLRRRLLDYGAGEVRVEVEFGLPPETVARAVTSGRFTLVVIGRKGRSPQIDGSLGSVSDAVVRATGVPVLLMPGGEPDLPRGVPGRGRLR